ncbi:hypothetical protein [Echinimonas agarilytica]|uniref:Uncharacterized protein n=1 Tax=Echinimonas agarilytica TaxID=1215918 RepID=A0AA41W5V0_9GAMM|nr:hypothetical protein [Echinimonas agarilytica]MCM2679425.1 hypothetical protein [Echinimonas agarilytica]
MRSFLKIFSSLTTLIVIVVVMMLFFIFSLSPNVRQQSPLTPEQTRLAHDKLREIKDNIHQSNVPFHVYLSNHDLNAFAALASHSLGGLTLRSEYVPGIVQVKAAIDVPVVPVYLNISCHLMKQEKGNDFSECRLGQLILPRAFIWWLLDSTVSYLFDESAAERVQRLLTQAEMTESRVILPVENHQNLIANVKASAKNVVKVIKQSNGKTQVDAEKVQVYLRHLERLKHHSSLAYYVGETMGLALSRSATEGAQEENTAAIWALAIKFGHWRFAQLAGVQPPANTHPVTLRDRHDLALHFLYSIVLEQIGEAAFGLKIGEAKEIMDSANGGSGFSFADLAADKAGLRFSNYLTAQLEHAESAQALLAFRHDENLFFPSLEGLPEGLSEDQFVAEFHSTESDTYRSIVADIQNRISQLEVYTISL